MKGRETSRGFATVQWPVASGRSTLGAPQLVRSVVRATALGHMASVAAVLAIYALLLLMPPLHPPKPPGLALMHLWWPLELLILVGTGGMNQGLALGSTGLLGGLLLLNQSHQLVRLGWSPWETAKRPFNLLLTGLVTLGMAALHSMYAREVGALTPLAFFILSFSGSLAAQLLDFQLYRRTRASLMGLNAVLALHFLARHSGLTFRVQELLMGTVSLCALAVLILLSFPRYVPVEAGEPPRQPLLSPFRRIDMGSALALSIITIALAVIGDALLSVLFSSETFLTLRPLAFAVLITWLGAAVAFYLLNGRFGLFEDVDPAWVAKNMARHFWTLAEVEPGSQTEAHIKRLLTLSQRWSMGVISFGTLLAGAILLSTSPLTRQVGMILVVIPLVIVLAGQFCYSVLASTHTALRVSAHQASTPFDFQLEAAPRLSGEANATIQSDWTHERAQKLVEAVINVCGRDETER